VFLFDFVFLCLLVSHQCIIHSRYGNQLRSGIRYWVLAILAILVLVLGIGKFVSSSLVLISVKGALASQHFLRAEGGGVVVKGVVCVRFSGCLPYHTVLELRNLLLQLDDGIFCFIRLAQRSSVSRSDPPQLGLVAEQEEHEEEDGRDGGAPGEVDVQVDCEEAVGIEQPRQFFALLDENIVIDQLLQCGQHTGFGHGKAGEGGVEGRMARE